MSRFLLDIHSAEKFIRVLADSAGLTVKYEDDVCQPRTDGKVVYVETPRSSWSDDEFTKWLFLVYHELGHNVPEMRDCFELPKKKKIAMDSFLGVLMNIIEDYRQEHFKYDEYEGKQKVMSKGRALFTYEQLAQYKAPTDPKHAMLRSAHTFTTSNAEAWMPDLIGASNAMYDISSTEQQEWIDALKAGNYSEALNTLGTAEDTYNLSKRIIKEVFKLDPEKEEEEARKQYEEGDGTEGDEGEEGEGKSKGKGKGKGKKEDKASKVKYDDVLIHKHDDKSPSYTPVEIDYDGSVHVNDSYVPYNIKDFKVLDYTNVTHSGVHYYDEISVNTTGFSNKIKRLLTILSKATYEYGKKTGRIHNKNLFKVAVPASREFSEKIFKQKKISEILDTAVYVLVDMSGSMGGEKMVHAAQAAILLNDAIAKLGVPIEIAGFTERHTGPIHYVFKKFDSKCEGAHLKERIRKGTSDMSQNADGESILYSYNRIKQRKEKKKILIVLSDGQPAADRGHGIHGFTKKIVKEIEKQGLVNIYGIGIMTDSVKQFYKEYKVLEDSSQLEEVLLGFVKSKLLSHR